MTLSKKCCTFVTDEGKIQCHKNNIKDPGPIVDIYMKIGIYDDGNKYMLNGNKYEHNGFDHDLIDEFTEWTYHSKTCKVRLNKLLKFLDILDYLQYRGGNSPSNTPF
jgi:hypothetical protein